MEKENREVVISFPEYVRKIISRLEDEGYDAFAVGGCIRDSLLGRVPHDWDVTTAADPHETMRIFAEGDIHVIGTAGIRHGTVMVKAGDNVCEITTFRFDGDYKDHRRPDSVSFSKNIEDDLARRDFTMNAIAAKPAGDGCVIVDPFGGIGDISKKIIRTVGDPELRFTEDALRILRAVRFTSELGFSVDPYTVSAAVKLLGTLGYVSRERVTSELWRTLSGEYLGCATETFTDVFRCLSNNDCEEFLKHADSVKNPCVRLALMADNETKETDFFLNMRFPAKTVSLVRSLLKITEIPDTVTDVCRLMREFGDDIDTAVEYIRVVMGSAESDILAGIIADISEKEIPYKVSMLSVTGSDMCRLGFGGSDIGDVLEWLLLSVQNGYIENEHNALIEAAYEKIKKKY